MNISIKYQHCNLAGTTTPSRTRCNAMSTRHRTARRNTWRRLPELFGQPWTGTSRPTSLCWGGRSTLRTTSSTLSPDRGPRGHGGLRWNLSRRSRPPMWQPGGYPTLRSVIVTFKSIPGPTRRKTLFTRLKKCVDIVIWDLSVIIQNLEILIKINMYLFCNSLISRLEKTWKKRKEQYVWKKDE